MVGVPGKYKGCNTCRLRRVRCDNKRPYCRKCIDSGRDCAGYERERVFIIGTPQQQGRCSSHPRRTVSGRAKNRGLTSSGSEGSRSEEPERSIPPTPTHNNNSSSSSSSSNTKPEIAELTPEEPLRPAWGDLVGLSDGSKTVHAQIASLNTSLLGMICSEEETEAGGRRRTMIGLRAYEPPNTRPSMREEEFDLRAQCLVHVSDVGEARDEGSRAVTSTESICLFLYERNWSVATSTLPPWTHDPALDGSVKQLGPDFFKQFPAHHFFVRVFRPNAIFAALSNHKSIFLSNPEWTTTPWELHPKSALDRLFDIVALLPAILVRAAHITSHRPTVERRLLAQDLLGSCMNIDGLLDAWLISINDAPGISSSLARQQLYWTETQDILATGHVPFADTTYAFRDATTALSLVFYWAALLSLRLCIARLHQATFEPIVDTFPQLYPASPGGYYHMPQQPGSSLAMGMAAVPTAPMSRGTTAFGGADVRELAAKVCRGLDFVLEHSVQPDLAVLPLSVAEDFYRGVNAAAGGVTLELLWCEGFRARLTSRGQDIADVVQGRGWAELGRF